MSILKFGSAINGSPPIVITGWKDNISFFSSAKGRGTREPTWGDIGNGQYASNFSVDDELFVPFHVNHDYKLGSNAYPHIHFIVNSIMNVGETVVWEFGYILAKGHQQGESLINTETVFTLTYTADGTEVIGEHIVLECSDIQAFDLREPDTVILGRVKLISKTVVGDVFGILCDLHYESNMDSTLNKSPNFYE